MGAYRWASYLTGTAAGRSAVRLEARSGKDEFSETGIPVWVSENVVTLISFGELGRVRSRTKYREFERFACLARNVLVTTG